MKRAVGAGWLFFRRKDRSWVFVGGDTTRVRGPGREKSQI